MNRIKTQLEVLSQSEIELIHAKTLQILEKTGIKVPNDKCLALAKEYGAQVDMQKQIIYIKGAVMEALIQDFRENGGMNEEEFHTGHKLTGYISTQVHLVDPISGTRRAGVMDDVMKGIALAPHLKNIGQGFATVIPSDIPDQITDVALHRALYKYSKAGGSSFILTPKSSKYIIEMSKVMNYPVSYLLETISPLQFRPESLEMALTVAAAGYGMSLAPMVISGASGPVTTAGTLTLMNAEILASLFLIKAITGKTACYYGHGTHNMDLRSMSCSFGNPGQAFFAIASAQLGKYYGMWAGSNSALTDAVSPDFQSGVEKGITGVISALCGAVNVGCQGIAGADQGFSFEQLVLDDEWIGYMNYIMEGFEVTEDTIAAELIEEIGIGGDFLAEEHTIEYMAQSRNRDNLFTRNFWSAKDSDNQCDNVLLRAKAFIDEKTEGYQNMEPVIDSVTAKELDSIYAKAVEELG